MPRLINPPAGFFVSANNDPTGATLDPAYRVVVPGPITDTANEVAVAAFLEGRLSFLNITWVVEEALDGADATAPRDLDDVTAADAAARRHAAEALKVA